VDCTSEWDANMLVCSPPLWTGNGSWSRDQLVQWAGAIPMHDNVVGQMTFEAFLN